MENNGKRYIALIAGGVTRAYLAYQTGQINEEAVTTSTTAILSGIGLILAKDADGSVKE